MTAGRVLVVDDTAFNRRLLVRLLTSIGHDAVEADDGRDALDLLRDADAEPRRRRPARHRHARRWTATRRSRRSRPTPRSATCRSSSSPASTSSRASSAASRWAPPTTCPRRSTRRSCAPGSRRRWPRSDCTTSSAQTLEQQRRLLATIDRQRSELSRFLSPQVAALVSSDDGEAMLAGHRREITAMFCDLRNFTSFSETAEPEEVLGFLRAYHGADGSAHRRARGDARALRRRRVHDVLQRPGPPARPRRAGRRAWPSRCASASPRCRREWRKRGHVLEIGIGIATGYATLGRIGFEGRYDYGAVGHGDHPRRAPQRRGRPRRDPHRAAGRSPRPRTRSTRTPAGDRQLKGFSRPIPVYAVTGDARRTEAADMTADAIDPAAFAICSRSPAATSSSSTSSIDTYLDDGDGPARGDARGGGGRRRRGDRPAGPQPQVEQRQRRGAGARRAVSVARGRCAGPAPIADAGRRGSTACEAAFERGRGRPARRTPTR